MLLRHVFNNSVESLSYHKAASHVTGLLATRTNPAFHRGSVYTSVAEGCVDSRLHSANPLITELTCTLDFLEHFNIDL